MKNNIYRPLPQAGGNRYKLRLAIIGRRVVLVIPPGMTGVVIRLRQATESQFSPGAVARSKAGDAQQETTRKAELCLDSTLNSNFNN